MDLQVSIVLLDCCPLDVIAAFLRKLDTIFLNEGSSLLLENDQIRASLNLDFSE